ncbi:MAG: hypothetical protein ABSB49_15340 [Polyangia bacterium]
MTTAWLLALLAASGASSDVREELPGEVSESLQHALAVPSARIVPVRWTGPKGCPVVSVEPPRPIEGSGRVPVRVFGRGCTGWGWVELQVWAKTSVTTRAVRAGEPVAPASTLAEREIRPGRPPFIVPFAAVAARSLPMGAVVASMDVSMSRVALGDPIKVVLVAGALVVETTGRRSQCLRSRDCAILASGRRVEGEIDDNDRLVVEVPR